MATGVYSTATLNAEGTGEDHSSIHVGPVAERIIKVRKARKKLPELTIDPEPSVDAVCNPDPLRLPTRPTRASKRRRLEGKAQRGAVKAGRQRVTD